MIDLTDAEHTALAALVRRAIEQDTFPRAPRLDPLRSALAKLDPAAAAALRRPLTAKNAKPAPPERNPQRPPSSLLRPPTPETRARQRPGRRSPPSKASPTGSKPWPRPDGSGGTGCSGAARPRASTAKFSGEHRPELQHPSSDRFVGDVQPGSASKSSTSRKLRVKRRYNHTACRMMSGGNWWRANKISMGHLTNESDVGDRDVTKPRNPLLSDLGREHRTRVCWDSGILIGAWL
jgi:hypothetical protein